MEQKLIELKEEKEKAIIIVRDFNIQQTKKQTTTGRKEYRKPTDFK